MDDTLQERSEAYLDRLFGPGAGRRHTRFLEHLEDEALRESLHRCHVLEADDRDLSIADNYLLGTCVLLAVGSPRPASFFVKTLLHLGTDRRRILAATSRLSMWIGPIRAAEAAVVVQRAIREYERDGAESLRDWFPEGEAEDV